MTLAIASILLFYTSVCVLLLITFPKLGSLHRYSFQCKIAQIRYDVYDYATRTDDAYADTKIMLRQALPAALNDAKQSSAVKIVFDSVLLRLRGYSQKQAQQSINTLLGDVRQAERLKIKVLVARLCEDTQLYLLHQCPAFIRHTMPGKLSARFSQHLDNMVALWVHSRLQLHLEDHDLQASRHSPDTGWTVPDAANTDDAEETQDDFRNAA